MTKVHLFPFSFPFLFGRNSFKNKFNSLPKEFKSKFQVSSSFLLFFWGPFSSRLTPEEQDLSKIRATAWCRSKGTYFKLIGHKIKGHLLNGNGRVLIRSPLWISRDDIHDIKCLPNTFGKLLHVLYNMSCKAQGQEHSLIK